jgi:hypothetical protein
VLPGLIKESEDFEGMLHWDVNDIKLPQNMAKTSQFQEWPDSQLRRQAGITQPKQLGT